MRQKIRKEAVRKAWTWPIWLGVAGTIFAVAAVAVFDLSSLLTGTAPPNHTAFSEPMQLGLRVAFLLISIGALSRLRAPLAAKWKWTTVAALAILFCGVAMDVAGALVHMGWITDFNLASGADDSLERRLFRLGSMAAYAIPMLALLAAGEFEEDRLEEKSRVSSRISLLLLRWEPLLFTIGVTTLASVLFSAAFIHKELTWLTPIGADTTVAACAAATIRARWRTGSLAFAGWFLVCASMTVGLLMGAYSFGGPVPTPTFVGDYNALPRMLLRDGHVVLFSLGIVGIAIAAARKAQECVL